MDIALMILWVSFVFSIFGAFVGAAIMLSLVLDKSRSSRGMEMGFGFFFIGVGLLFIYLLFFCDKIPIKK